MNGHPVCTPCRTCPHGEKWWHSTCFECLRELHTVYHLTGPVIADMNAYTAMAKALEVSLSELLVWNWREEAQLLAPSVDSSSRLVRDFPWPLLHHLHR